MFYESLESRRLYDGTAAQTKTAAPDLFVTNNLAYAELVAETKKQDAAREAEYANLAALQASTDKLRAERAAAEVMTTGNRPASATSDLFVTNGLSYEELAAETRKQDATREAAYADLAALQASTDALRAGLAAAETTTTGNRPASAVPSLYTTNTLSFAELAAETKKQDAWRDAEHARLDTLGRSAELDDTDDLLA